MTVDNHKPWLVCTDKVSVDSIRTVDNHKTLKNNEPVIFKITNFKAYKTSKLCVDSNTFYSHPGVYKMSIGIFPNGNGDNEGTHLSVFTELIEGCYDNQLHWPFLGTVTVELLNQLGDYNHHRVVRVFDARDDMRIGSSKGHPKFLPHTSLGHNPATNTQYLLDDTLYFRVSVKVDSCKPWLVCTHHS